MNVTTVHVLNRVETLRSPVQQLPPGARCMFRDVFWKAGGRPAESREAPPSTQVLLWLLSLLETC